LEPLASAKSGLCNTLSRGIYCFRVNRKTGDYEASGPKDLLEQFQRFLELSESDVGAARTHQEPPPTDEHPQESTYARAFEERDDLLVLGGKPLGSEDEEADALLMILFGYKTLRKQDTVLGTRVARAGRGTGFKVERLDRSMMRNKQKRYVMVKGKGRSTEYGLTGIGQSGVFT